MDYDDFKKAKIKLYEYGIENNDILVSWYQIYDLWIESSYPFQSILTITSNGRVQKQFLKTVVNFTF